MPRRSDAEIRADLAQKQAQLTERMAKKADPTIGVLADIAHDLDSLMLSEEDTEKIDEARGVLLRIAHERVAAWASKQNG